MVRIVQKEINVAFKQGHHQHCLICQIPNNLQRQSGSYKVADPEQQWQQVRSIFELVASGKGNLKKLHFLFFPESILPLVAVSSALEMIEQRFRSNTVTVFGVEHVSLTEFREQLRRFAVDNKELLASVEEDMDSGDVDDVPVNWCIIAVKEDSGRLRVFLEAKSHPFTGEENLDRRHDLYRGKIFWLFRCHPTCFNFMALICLDYIYRDLYQSNISTIIETANQLFFETRQRLDLLAVIECNPKPEHQAFRDVINGFYGEYLGYTPGVRDASTLFCNVSSGTRCEGIAPETEFGQSAIILHASHNIERINSTEFITDDFDGLPVCRLRFGSQPRLFYFNLPLFYELDPRNTRMPLKIHSIFRPAAADCWKRMIADEFTAADKSGKSL